jgi:hypothetical protein
MAYARPLFSDVRQRANYLLGDETAGTYATLDSSINLSVNDYLLAYPFSWDITSTTGSLSSGTFSLATNYIPKWGIDDARIVVSSTNDDHIFKPIDFRDRDQYGSDQYVYWITSTAAGVYTFNTPIQTGTVTYYYHYFPVPMSAPSDPCLVVDVEAVALFAASKHWINDERNQALSHDYEDKAKARVDAAYAQDLNFGTGFLQESVASMNPGLTQR